MIVIHGRCRPPPDLMRFCLRSDFASSLRRSPTHAPAFPRMPLAAPWLRRWRQLMYDWFQLMNLMVNHARAAARTLGYPATTVARRLAMTFAKDLGYSCLESPAGGAPPPQVAKPPPEYDKLDRARSLCSHVGDQGKPATKQYTAAGSQWMTCNLCGRRWQRKGDDWVINDRDHPSNSRKSPGSSASSAVSSSIQAPSPQNRSSTSSASRREPGQNRTGRRPQQQPFPEPAAAAVVVPPTDSDNESPWEFPDEEPDMDLL